jgi:arabinogalactan endo-1,4-beta-galactosidase
MATLYIHYRIIAWQTVNQIIDQAEQTTQSPLDEATRRVAKGVVINWLIEVSQLPVDLVPETVPIQDSLQALQAVSALCHAYFSVYCVN